MSQFYRKLFNSPISPKKNTFWYTLGSLCSSASSVLLMIYVTRILGTNEAGIFSIAYSVSQLMLSLGWFGTRQFQVSDIEENYKFSDYFILKIFLSVLLIVGGFIYAVYLHSDSYKTLIIILLCLFILNDVFADLFSARFQQINKLHLAGKSYCIRIIGSNVTFLLSLFITHSLPLSLILATLYSALALTFFDFPMIKSFSSFKLNLNNKKLFELLKECFPLFVSSFLSNFIMNIPKNAIDLHLTSETQAFYNIISMPSAVATLFCMFVFVPQFTSIAVAWKEDIKRFFKLIFSILSILLTFAILILLCGWFLGIPVLDLLYSVNLTPYKMPFMILLLTGCVSSFNSVLIYILTVFRIQKYSVYIYVFTVVVSQLTANSFVLNYEIMGASINYLISMLCIFASYVIVIILHLRKFFIEYSKVVETSNSTK